RSKSRIIGFAGSDADDAIDVRDEDLAVANLAGLGGLENGFDYLIDEVAANGNFDLGLGDEVHDVLSAAIELGMAALTAEALHLRHRHARNAYLGQRRTDVVEFERLDDGGDQFHFFSPNSLVPVLLQRSRTPTSASPDCSAASVPVSRKLNIAAISLLGVRLAILQALI